MYIIVWYLYNDTFLYIVNIDRNPHLCISLSHGSFGCFFMLHIHWFAYIHVHVDLLSHHVVFDVYILVNLTLPFCGFPALF